MWLELKIHDYNCPNCDKEFDRLSDKVEYEEFDSECIDDSSHTIKCECGCVFRLQAEVEVMYHTIHNPKIPHNLPIDEATNLPDVVGDNQLPLFNTPSV
jgi:hypothetical protein